MSGAALWQPLPWDSEFFGVRIARLNPSRVAAAELVGAVEQMQAAGMHMAYALLDSDDDLSVRLAEAAGFHLVDVRMTFEASVGATARPAALRSAQEADLPRLKAIAATSYLDTRFFVDPRFSRERSAALYEVWVERSWHSPDEAVLVAEHDGKAAAFTTCAHKPGAATAQIGLVGVAADARGAGLGQRLVRGALAWCAERGATRLSVVTQGRNVAAQRLYQRCGFLTASVQLWYHKWFVPDDSFNSI